MSEHRSNIISAFHHLKVAKEYFQDLQRELPNTLADKLAKKNIDKIEWIYTNFVTIPQFPNEVREGVRNEWNSDALAIPEIMNKISLLDPTKRELIEEIVDALYRGEDIAFEENI